MMRPNIKLTILFIAALIVGLGITWIDSSPGWDDTAISVMLVLGASAFFSLLMPKYLLLWAFLIGAWIPLYALITQGNYAAFLAFGIALVGSLIGAMLGTLMFHTATPEQSSPTS